MLGPDQTSKNKRGRSSGDLAWMTKTGISIIAKSDVVSNNELLMSLIGLYTSYNNNTQNKTKYLMHVNCQLTTTGAKNYNRG